MKKQAGQARRPAARTGPACCQAGLAECPACCGCCAPAQAVDCWGRAAVSELARSIGPTGVGARDSCSGSGVCAREREAAAAAAGCSSPGAGRSSNAEAGMPSKPVLIWRRGRACGARRPLNTSHLRCGRLGGRVVAGRNLSGVRVLMSSECSCTAIFRRSHCPLVPCSAKNRLPWGWKADQPSPRKLASSRTPLCRPGSPRCTGGSKASHPLRRARAGRQHMVAVNVCHVPIVTANQRQYVAASPVLHLEHESSP